MPQARTHAPFWILPLVVIVIAGVVFLARYPTPTFHPAPPPSGWSVFEEHCVTCHNDAVPGLALHGVFQHPTLLTGAPADDTAVRSLILHGHGRMPPFEGTLSPVQLQVLVQYLHHR
jgi:mono/diheme cytochrome c family protein